jgi:hypothetical protein
MLNLIILICCLLGIPVLITKYLDDAWVGDGKKRQLRDKFESWWITVADYDRLKFALICTNAFKSFIDGFFGTKLFSKRAFFRCTVIASGLLLASLTITGLSDHQILGVMPWANYHDSCKAVSDYADMVVSSGLTKNGVLERPNVSLSSINMNPSAIDGGTLPMAISALTMSSTATNPGDIQNNFTMLFYFSKRAGTNANNLSSAQIWSNNVATIRQGVEKYDTTKYAVGYSIGFYLALFIANAILCFASLVLCRKILDEICAVGRTTTVISLLISNFFCLLIGSSVFLLLLLILSVPLFWIVLPFASAVAESSFVIFTLSVLTLSFTIWTLNCIPLNLIAIIAFLPFFFSLFATFFSLLAMIGRNWIHSFVSNVFLKCAEKSPLLVIGGGFGTMLAIITILAKAMREVF